MKAWLGNIALSLACLVGVSVSAPVQAAFPDRPVQFIVGYAAGGGTDLLARIVGQKLSEKWGQPVVIVNKPGSDGRLADDLVAHAPPDGYTFVLAAIAHTVVPEGLQLNYQPIKSFAPVTLMVTTPMFLFANTDFAANSLADVLAMAKAKPNGLSYGSSGPGSPGVLATLLLEKMTNVRMMNVNYRGAAPIVPALLRNEVPIAFLPIVTGVEHVKSGKLKILTVTSKQRFPMMPDVPTVTEAANLPGYEMNNWYGVLAPAGTPADIVNKIRDDIAEALRSPDVQKTLTDQAFLIVASSPQQFVDFLIDDLAKWTDLQKTTSIK